MSFKVGDPVFSPQGLPATVTAQDPLRGTIKVDTDLKQVQETHRHGYKKGLEADTRQTFNGIMDEVKTLAEPMEKIEALQKRIRGLEETQKTQKDQRLLSYLKSELFHLMTTQHVHPREYEISYSELSNESSP